jgi:hypothetical protein
MDDKEKEPFFCYVAHRAADFWDWFDKRDIDKHLASWFTFIATWHVTQWALSFVAHHPEKTGIEAAAIIASVMVPWSGLQAAAIKWYFESRPTG